MYCTSDTHLNYLLIICNVADQSWPEALGNEVSQPEPSQDSKVKVVRQTVNISEVVSGLRIATHLRHE